MRSLALALLALPALFTSPGFADAVGNAQDVDPASRAIYERVDAPLLIGADIFIGQQIITSELGQVEILFNDGTKLAIGPRSTLTIDDYLIRSNGSAGKFAIDALKGTFRFVTGNAAKDRYEIKTPTGTIGVRGTAFDFFVDENGHVALLLYHGAATLCSATGECALVTNRCDLGTLSDAGPELLGSSLRLGRADINALRQSLPFAVSQLTLGRNLWQDKARECLKTAGRLRGTGTPSVIADQTPVGDTEPVIIPPPPPPPPPPPEPDTGDDCAGNSDHNPGHSQNCGRGGG